MKFAVIAAGEGSRLSQEGIESPKPLVKISGECLIDRLIRIFSDCNATEIVIIVNTRTQEVYRHIEKLLATRDSKACPIRLVAKTTPSSMHSFYEISPYLEGSKFCLTTVDTIFNEAEFHRYINAFQTTDCDGLMAVTDYVDDESPLYVATDSARHITAFHDVCQRDFYVSGGIYCLNTRAIKSLQGCMNRNQSRMRNFQRAMIADGLALQAYPFSKILDVDHATDIGKAEAFLALKPSTEIMGIRRAPCFSPNALDRDEAIFADVCRELIRKGYGVRTGNEEALAMPEIQPDVLFSMGRHTATLDRLTHMEKEGTRVLNPPQGVTNGIRERLTRILAENNIPHPRSQIVQLHEMTSISVSVPTFPCWIKRGDCSAQQPFDVCFVKSQEELRQQLTSFRDRGVRSVVICDHLAGDLIKFYGVEPTAFFYWFYPKQEGGYSKYGLEVYNGDIQNYPFDEEMFRDTCHKASRLVGLPIYGGDAIIDSDGNFHIIDFNDWPSFAPCLHGAGQAIASLIINCIKQKEI